MENTPAYTYLHKYLKSTFPDMSEKELKENTEKWMGLMRTVRFQEWVNKHKPS